MTKPARRLVDAIVVAALVLLALGSVGLHVDRYTKVSPVDEMQHIDYLYRAPFPPAYGSKVGQDAMREQTCRGLDLPGNGVGPCVPGATYDANAFQERGYSTGSMNSPVYYTLTKALAVPLGAVMGTDSLVTPGRLVGGLWLALGLAISYLVGVRRGIGRGAMGSVLAVLAASPALVFPSATISPDSMGLLAGALVLASLTKWKQTPTWRWAAVFVVTAAFVTSLKLTFILAVGAAALYLLVSAMSSKGIVAGIRSRETVLALTSVGASLTTALGWLFIQSQRRQMDPDALPDLATRFLVPEFPWSGMMETSLQLLTPLASPWVVVGNPIQLNFVTLVPSMVLLGGVVGAGLFRATGRPHSDLATATLVVALVGCLGLTAVSYITSQSYFPLPPRYASALVPAMAVSAAALVRDRVAVYALGGIALMALTVNLLRLTALG